MEKVEHALALAAQGFKVFPIKPGAKAPPLLNGWPQKATSDPTEVRQLWAAVPDANIGIHCAGMIVVDVDVKKGGDESLQALDMIYGIPETLTVRTPTGGRHFYFHSDAAASNGVDVLGRGVDTRASGGYVLAPGSSVPAGEYAFENTAPIAEAPDWLVAKTKPIGAKKATANLKVPPAEPSTVERAKSWLEGQPGAVEGAGGDAFTYAIACSLRDLGVSESQAVELLTAWNAKCEPPWEVSDLEAKAANAFRYAQNAPGSAAAGPDDFPEPEPDKPVAPHTGATRLLQFANSERRGPGYLVKGVLQRRSHAVAYGAPGEGKTFIALDLAYHIAAGKDWMGRKVHPGLVLYLAYEGTGGLVKRAQALLHQYGAEDVPLYVEAADFNLREMAGRNALGTLISSLPEKPVLVVIDTLARALKGGDENSAQDMGALNDAIAALISATNACVLLIHHSGKNKAAGARGSSALLGAIDTELEVDDQQVIAHKQRDVELSDPIAFALAPVVVGVDEDGEDLTSCVVLPSQAKLPTLARLTGNSASAFSVLCDLAKDNAPVAKSDWLAACVEQLEVKRRSFYDLVKKLEHGGYVTVDGDFVTRRLE